MQAAAILAALQRATQFPALAGIYVKSVAIAAPYDWTAESLMTITWSMPDASAAVHAPGLAGVQGSMISRPSNTAILLPRDLASVAEIEDAVLPVAWQLGAWDLVRLERPPLASGADWHEPKQGVGVDFGVNAYRVGDQELVTGDDSTQAAEIAAAQGYVLWRFVPLALCAASMRAKWTGKDNTLQTDGTRTGAPSHHRARWWHPQTPGQANEHQYQLGRANHGNRSKAAKERRA